MKEAKHVLYTVVKTLQGNCLALRWFSSFSRVSYLITKEDSDLWLVPKFLTPFIRRKGGVCVGGACGVKAPLAFFLTLFSNADWRRCKCSECGSGGAQRGQHGKPEIK